MVTGNAKVCGVIGNPVGHSLSPLMHNEIAQALGLDYIYVPCPVAEGAAGDAVRGAYALGFEGLNVTVPYKQQVIPFLAKTDESVRCIGACNTLVRLPEKGTGAVSDEKGFKGYKGYNTDAEGLFRTMREQGMEIRGRDCLLIGAGGAARAAAYLMVRENAASVTILNRSLDKAELLAADIRRMKSELMWSGISPGQKARMQDGVGQELRTKPQDNLVPEQGTQLAWRGVSPEQGTRPQGDVLPGEEIAVSVLPLDQWRRLPGDSYLAVQTTSVGMYPHTDAAPVEDAEFYKKIAQAVDIIYTPSETRFMKYVKQAGGRVCGGLDMLIYQGVAALELWNPGVKVPREVVDRVRRGMEEQLHG